MYTDKFELLDADGNVIATKTILHYMKIVLAERGWSKAGREILSSLWLILGRYYESLRKQLMLA